jgi:methyl-accepting chemotaxis protein
MTKLLKNLKISTTILFMSILSIVFISVIGALGFINMRTLNNNMTLMYKQNLQPIAQIGVIRGNFLNMRLESFSAMITYSGSVESNVTKYITKTNESIKSYQSGSLDGYETTAFTQFTEYYKQYLNQWEQIKSKLQKGQDADLTDRSTLNSIGVLAEEKLSQIRDYNEKQANQVNESSNVLFLNTFRVMLAIFASCVVFFLLTSIFIMKVIKNSAAEMIKCMEVVADGDFSIELDTHRKDEFGLMKKSLSKTISTISVMLKDLKNKSQAIDTQSESLSLISDEMASSAESVAVSVSQVSSGASSQAQELITITETLNEFSEKLENMADAIKDVDIYTKGVNSTANESNENMETLIASVNKVSSSFNGFETSIASLSSDINKISEITNFINSISEQTNLLALNAAIEAARAGEAGRGFSVVADEIRKLAEQSKISSENINSLIRGVSGNSASMVRNTETMSFEVENQVSIIKSTITSFKKIITSVNSIIPQIDQINTLALSINDDKSSILQRIEASSSIAEEVSASSEEISAASEEMSSSSGEVAASAQVLSEMTKEMMEQVSKFKLSE